MDRLLHVEGLTKAVPGKTGVKLLSAISAGVSTMDKIAVVGPSGQGKTTLLRILAQLEPFEAGELYLHGRPRREWQPRVWRQKVCYVSQHPYMLGGSVEFNLRTASRLHGTAYEDGLAGILLEKLGLGGIDLSKDAGGLSGGEMQRISLIRALLLRPELLLLDEITASLDERSKLAVERLLEDWHRNEGTPWVWITHDMEQAARTANAFWALQGGALRILNDAGAIVRSGTATGTGFSSKEGDVS